MTPLAMVLLEEYRTVKAEQNDRLKTRDALVYATMAVIGVVTYTAITIHQLDLLLGVPAGVLVLGWLFLGNDRKIAWARAHLRADLRVRLAAELSTATRTVSPDELLRWETPPRYWGLPLWRFGGLWHDLALFVASPVVVLAWWAAERWDGTFTNPLGWGWAILVFDLVQVTIAVFASTAARQPIYGRKAGAR